MALLPAAGPGILDAVVAPLINELAALGSRLVLVFDDYHVVDAEPIHASVGFLVRHLPRGVQLAITSRAEPPLPLGTMRARREMLEVRASDLRFGRDEADALLNGTLGLELDASDVESLRARTEGWPAGLQLAALSLRGHPDKRAFVDAFAGDDRQIGGYLHELLLDLPPSMRQFLLSTSVLERMCVSLCDAMIDGGDAGARLAEAERANLFLVPLDSRREWYRYRQSLPGSAAW